MGLVLFYILSRNPSDALKKAKCKPKFPLILPGILKKVLRSQEILTVLLQVVLVSA